MRKNLRRAFVLTEVATAALIAACGGGGDSASQASATADDSTDGMKTVESASAVTTTTNWTFCATENAVCSFTGTRLVRYGSGTTFVTRTFTNGVACNNSTFGDPLKYVVKHCQTAPAPAPAPAP